MNTLSQREHARIARALIEACGGLDEATRNCRVSKSKLSDYQNPNQAVFMPADVMAELEVFCGQPVYSTALAGRFGPVTAHGDLAEAACRVTEAAAIMQQTVREALADGVLTPREIDDVAATERQVADALDKLRATRRAAEDRGRP